MSRGPGRWQRLILEALTTHECIFLRDVLPKEHTVSQRLACKRAARRLAQAGRVRTEGIPRHGWQLTDAGRRILGHTLVLRPGATPDYAKFYQERVKPYIYRGWWMPEI
jgi:hypothetical protein